MGSKLRRRLVNSTHKLLYSDNSPSRMAVSSSIGVLVGILPLAEYKLVISIILAVVFRLNIFAVIVGMAAALIPTFFCALYYLVGMDSIMETTPYYNSIYSFIIRLRGAAAFDQYGFGFHILLAVSAAVGSFPLFKRLFRWRTSAQRKWIDKKSIFLDCKGLRWHYTKRLVIVLFIIVLAALLMFAVSLLRSPFQSDLRLKQGLKEQGAFDRMKIFGFYTSGADNAMNSLRRHVYDIDVLIPDWYRLDLNLELNSNIDQTVDKLVKKNGVKEMPLVTNLVSGKWDGELVHRLLVSQQARQNIINNICVQIKENRYDGVCIDFHNVTTEDKDLLVKFMKELADIFHKNGLKVAQTVPVGDNAFKYRELSQIADYVIITLYNEHHPYGEPGPLSSRKWIQRNMESLDIMPEKLIFGLASYGYDWCTESMLPAKEVSFAEIMETAEKLKLQIFWDKEAQNPFMKYYDSGKDHIVWYLDGVTFYNHMIMVREEGGAGIALWRLGFEEPAVWSILELLNCGNIEDGLKELEKVRSPEWIVSLGQGDILNIVSTAKEGTREIELDSKGLVVTERYNSYSRPFKVEKYGRPEEKKIALTFDDGPDRDYTPRVLDILEKYNVKATFFIVGKNALSCPDILKRIYEGGHDIGNHTFSHIRMQDAPTVVQDMQLNLNQRLIQSITGHSTILFRPPYIVSTGALEPEDLYSILRAQKAGYITMGHSIIPRDWEAQPSRVIVDSVKRQMQEGNVILLHDSGGDRTSMLEALPQIIELLHSKGYRFVTASQVMEKEQEIVMPPVEDRDKPLVVINQAIFTVMGGFHKFCYLFYFAIIIGCFRLVFLLVFSAKHKIKHAGIIRDTEFKPLVSIIIPAYNEEKVIYKTVRSALKSDYPEFEVIVVDDGSTDNTAEVVSKAFSKENRVRLITKQNEGKSTAINQGISESSGEIIVCIDADTVIAEDAVGLMVKHFKNPTAAAASGNVKIGNRHNLLTTWQHIEYVTGFNLERRAYAELNCITVVPGAIGAWRKEAVKEAGGFKDDTVAEDADITLTLLRKGYKVVYEEKAYAYTEAPEDLRGLMKQRFRWLFGILQCLWKHRKAMFNSSHRSLGFFALPSMWLFQYVFQTISPVIDMFFIASMFSSDISNAGSYYFLFLALDYLVAIYAFGLERERLKPLFWLFIQRIVYRWIIVYAILKSIISAVRGQGVGWNKLKRMGHVRMSGGKK